MTLRFTLIALLVLGTGAWAGEGDGPRAPEAPPRAPGAPRAPRPPAVHRRIDPGDDHGTTRTDTTMAVTPRARLELDNFEGGIVVTGWDRNAVRVQAEHGPGTSVDCEVGPTTVALCSIRLVRIPDPRSPRHVRLERIPFPTQVDYRLTVPRSMSLRLSGVNSPISVAGVEGDISAESVNGLVAVRGSRGTVKVSAVSGGVEVIGARGSVEASSINDDVTLQDIAGSVHVESVSGDVDLERITSDEVEASTVAGALRYAGAIRPGGSYHLESHSGDLTVVLPERPDVSVSVSTYSGEFASSFPFQSEAVPTTVRGRGQDLDFTLGGGRAELSLESFSGRVRLVRAGEPAPPAHTHRDKKVDRRPR